MMRKRGGRGGRNGKGKVEGSEEREEGMGKGMTGAFRQIQIYDYNPCERIHIAVNNKH